MKNSLNRKPNQSAILLIGILLTLVALSVTIALFAVLVYFIDDPNRVESPDGQVLFVLLKGRKDAGGSFAVTQIVYGDSQQAAMTAIR